MINAFTIAKPTFFKSTTAKEIIILLLGVMVIAIAAQLSVPLKPVPLTFQSSAAILIGMLYGAKRGAVVVSVYLLAGALGLPCLADFSGGFIYFFHPSGGYLLGLLPAAFVTGYFAERGYAKTLLGSLGIVGVGAIIIFACGVSVLAVLYGWQQAIAFGVLPFIATESIKLLVLAMLTSAYWRKR